MHSPEGLAGGWVLPPLHPKDVSAQNLWIWPYLGKGSLSISRRTLRWDHHEARIKKGPRYKNRYKNTRQREIRDTGGGGAREDRNRNWNDAATGILRATHNWRKQDGFSPSLSVTRGRVALPTPRFLEFCSPELWENQVFGFLSHQVYDSLLQQYSILVLRYLSILIVTVNKYTDPFSIPRNSNSKSKVIDPSPLSKTVTEPGFTHRSVQG